MSATSAEEQPAVPGSEALRIFLNYRHSDAAGFALALFDPLASHFGAAHVFFDAVTLEAGDDWQKEIRSQSSACGVLLALIGPTWGDALDARAALAAEDQVRAEIESALRSEHAVVIPVLVGDAEMPDEQTLPPSLRPLARREAIALRTKRWLADVTVLLERLDGVRRPPSPAAGAPAPPRLSTVRPAPSAREPDADHYEEVALSMLDDGVVPFLGPDANSSDREQPWQDPESGNRPDAEELAHYLAAKLRPEVATGDLAQIAQYLAVAKGSGELNKLLRMTLTQRCPPSSTESFLAGMPGRLRSLGRPVHYQLIVTTNYDDALERAFDDAGEPYDLAVYMANGSDRGRFVHVPFDGEPHAVTLANGYRDFPINQWGMLSRTVIVKIHGAVDQERGPYAWHDNYVITEDDYIDYLSNSPVTAVVPQQILGKLRDSHFLFLGYSLRDWNLRVFVNRTFGQRLPNNSWAIQREPHRLDTKFWRRIGVDLYGAPLGDYVRRLDETLADCATRE